LSNLYAGAQGGIAILQSLGIQDHIEATAEEKGRPEYPCIARKQIRWRNHEEGLSSTIEMVTALAQMGGGVASQTSVKPRQSQALQSLEMGVRRKWM
jgi:hypothetical protein